MKFKGLFFALLLSQSCLGNQLTPSSYNTPPTPSFSTDPWFSNFNPWEGFNTLDFDESFTQPMDNSLILTSNENTPLNPAAFDNVMLEEILLSAPLAPQEKPPAKTELVLAPQQSNTKISPALTSQLLQINLNGIERPGTALTYENSKKDLFLRGSDLESWGVKLPNTPPQTIHQIAYYNLRDYQGVQYDIDTRTEEAHIALPATNFLPTHINIKQEEKIKADKPPLGAFFNYDIFSQKNPGANFQTSGLFEPAIFSPIGSGVSDFLVVRGNHQDKAVRLNSTWNIDQPDRMESWHIGDSFSVPGMWGSSVDFGGVQWGTNFSTQPNFITFPLPNASGNALLPSTAEVFLNNSLIANEKIANGPFTLNNLPVTNGTGDLNMVVTNVLGKQEVINIPYYADRQLLKPGLQNYSVEAGFIRKNFSTQSNDYGKPLLSNTYTRGITTQLTLQEHAELRESTQALGFGGNYQVGKNIGILSTAAAMSRHHRMTGELVQVGFTRDSTHLSVGGKTTLTSANYRSLGFGENKTPPPIAQSQLFMSLPLAPYLEKTSSNKTSIRPAHDTAFQKILNSSSVGVTYISQVNRGIPNQNIVSGNLSFKPINRISSTLTALTDLSNSDNNAILFTTSMSFDNGSTASITASEENHSQSINASYQHNAPVNGGLGYSAIGSVGNDRYASAGVNYRHPYGSLSANVARDQTGNAYQFEASGGSVLMNKEFYLTKNIDNSFALVDLHGIPNISVQSGGNPKVFSNSRGYALLPNLLPYMKNKVRLENKNIPETASIDATETTVVPYYRSGVIVDFPIKRITSVTLHLHQKNGKPVPAGASISVNNKSNVSIVGNNGFVYLTNLAPHNKISVHWLDHTCHVTFDYHANTTIQQSLGTKVCLD